MFFKIQCIAVLQWVVFMAQSNDVDKIAKENAFKKEAQQLFEKGEYEVAIEKFSFLIDSLKVKDDVVLLNLAHSYFKSKKYEEASKTYEKTFAATDKNIKSVAAQQLGVLAYTADQDKDKALTYFKEALKANPNNEEARYNYELLKKLKNPEQNKDNQQNKDDKKDKEDEKDQPQNQNKNQKQDQNKDNKGGKDDKNSKDKGQDSQNDSGKGDKKGDKKEDKSPKESDKNNPESQKGDKKDGGNQSKNEESKADPNKNGEKGQSKNDQKQGKEEEAGAAQKEKEGGNKDKDKLVANPEALMQMGLTEQRAKAILDAMRSGEVQYLQQMKREPAKKKKSNKPDW